MSPQYCFNFVRDIPYRIPLSLDETDHCCLGKTTILKALLEGKSGGLDVRPMYCEFRWSEVPFISEKIKQGFLFLGADDFCGHVYLEAKLEGRWKVVDPTWDIGLKRILPVNEWAKESENKIAVPPTKIYSPKDSYELFMEEESERATLDDLVRNGFFYLALNNLLDQERKRNKLRLNSW